MPDLCSLPLNLGAQSTSKQSNPPRGKRRGDIPPFLDVSLIALRKNVEFPHSASLIHRAVKKHVTYC